MYWCRDFAALEQSASGLDFTGCVYSIAEEHHLIVPLTRYVMAETIRQRHVFPMSSQFHVGINVAPSHFRRGVLIKDLNQYWFSAHPIQQLILEITERDALLDVDYRIARELHRKTSNWRLMTSAPATVHFPGLKHYVLTC